MNSQGSCLVPVWFHDGSEVASPRNPMNSHGSRLVPVWFHDGSDIANPRSPTNSQGSCLVPRWHGTFVIEGNFRTCLIQTGANCFLRFGFRGDEGGSRGGAKGVAVSDHGSRRGRRPRARGCSGPSGHLIILIKGAPPIRGAAARMGRGPPLISIIIGECPASSPSSIPVVL